MLEETGAVIELHLHSRPADAIAVAGEVDISRGLHFVARLPIGQAFSEQNRIALAHLDPALGDNLDIIRAGDSLCGDEGRQVFARSLQEGRNARRRAQGWFRQFAGRYVGGIQGCQQRALFHLRRFLWLGDGFGRRLCRCGN
jgi:hypothetical protein